LSAATYATVIGFVQEFPGKDAVTDKEITGVGTVYEFMVRAVGFTGQPLVKITVWPEYAGVVDQIGKGAFVAADGKYTQNVVGDKTYHNLSASSGLVVIPGEQKAEGSERAVVNAVATGTEAPF
jgi:hypothetical protein